ncbi:MAG: hypothetical protein AAB786_00670 [Patescibacteria group bacterium]
MPKIKNIIIFLVIGIILVLVYIFFIKASPDEDASLVSSLPDSQEPMTTISGDTSAIAQEFLALLLNVKNIKLNDAIFSSNAFRSLHDSSIILIPDGNEGRPNPFAPIGTDVVVLPPIDTTAPATTGIPATVPPTTNPAPPLTP